MDDADDGKEGAWQIRINARDYPVQDIKQLKDWVRTGRLRPEHHVFDPRVNRWVQASELNDLLGLFPSSGPSQPVSSQQRPSVGTPGQLGWLGLLFLLAGPVVGGMLMKSLWLAIIVSALGVGFLLIATFVAISQRAAR